MDEIEAVYRGRLRELQRLATAITGSREAGRDAVQDAFARAVHRRAEFRGEGSLEGWLWRIVVSTARDQGRRQPGSRELPWMADLDRPSADAGAGESVELRQLLARLPERQRLALFLRYYGDLDYSTIAEALEVSAGTIAATLSQARSNLRRLMEVV